MVIKEGPVPIDRYCVGIRGTRAAQESIVAEFGSLQPVVTSTSLCSIKTQLRCHLGLSYYLISHAKPYKTKIHFEARIEEINFSLVYRVVKLRLSLFTYLPSKNANQSHQPIILAKMTRNPVDYTRGCALYSSGCTLYS